MMMNEDLNFLDEKLSEYWAAIDSATNEAITKILDHYGLDIDYVKAHPDEFRILVAPCYGLDDNMASYVIEHKGIVLGSYTIHSHFDLDNMRVTCRINYTFGSDP